MLKHVVRAATSSFVLMIGCGRVGFEPRVADAPDPDEVVQISVGGKAACARLASGDVWCWGDNRMLLLGANLAADQSAVPVRVLLPGPAVDLEVDDANAFARLATGTVVGWGLDAHGQLGAGGPAPTPVPVAASESVGMTSATAVLCVIRADHSVACSGAGTEGALGDNSTADRATLGPVAIQGVQTASGGTMHLCALLDSGAASCWGRGTSGQLGDGSMSQQDVPTTGPPGPYTSIAAGDNFTCAVRVDRGVDCWGDNGRLQLGAVGPARSSAAPVTQLANAIAVVGGSSHACALLADRTVHCWGDDSLGELGDALGDMTSEPRAVPIEEVVEISSRTDLTTCARTGSGEVYCWGNNSAGQIGNGQVGGFVSTPSRVLGLPGSP